MMPPVLLVLLAVLASLPCAPAGAQTLVPPFDDDYTLTDLGSITSLPARYGGLTFRAGDANTIIIGGTANNPGGRLYTVPLTRDAGGRIVGFAGPAVLFADGAYNDGGVAYAPDGVLFYARYPVNEIGQIEAGSTMTDRVVGLAAAGVTQTPGGLNFVPPGYGGAGQLKLVSWPGGAWWSLAIAPDGMGTYDVTGATLETTVQGGPEGFTYVPLGSPEFANPSLLVSEYSAGVVSTYELDGTGDPVVATRRPVVTGLTGAEGAVIDPLTGDFLFSTFGGGDRVVIVRGFAIPPSTTIVTTTTTTTTTKPTNTTVVGSTTTTTVPGACAPGPTLASIRCRVEALLAFVRTASGLGPLQQGFVSRLEKAREAGADTADACAAAKLKQARNGLKRLDRRLLITRSRTRTNRARKVVPPALAATIADEAVAIRTDVRALRAALTCP